jgi:hypothetical protein
VPRIFNTRERLERGVLVLSVLDAVRKQSRIPLLGRSLENLIVGRELLHVEVSTALAEAEERNVAAPEGRGADCGPVVKSSRRRR